MSTQTTPHQSFPAPCKRCGGALYQPADLCPYCGTTHPLDERPRASFGAAAAAAASTGSARHAFAPEAQTGTVAPELASADTPIPPLGHEAPGAGNSTRTLLTRGIIAVVVVMLGYGAYTLFGGRSSAPSDGDEDTQSTGGSVAAYVPGTSTNPSSGGSSGHAVNGAVNGSVNALPHPGAAKDAVNNVRTAPPIVVQPPPAPHFRDLSESLRVARASRDANNLSGAQVAVNAAFAMQANSADAQMIQHELTPLEQRRDSAIQTALVCVKDNAWNCVEHSARDALAIDTGSLEAKALLERAIVETGWAPLRNKPAPVARAASAPQSAANETPLPPLPPLPAHVQSQIQAPAPAPAPAARTTQAAQSAQPAVADAPTTSSAPALNSVDAQERAIAQFGWKNSATPGTAPASGAAASH